MFCTNCGAVISERAVICVKCGVATVANPLRTAKSRMTYVLLGLFLGGLGIHNFYAGYTTKAVIQLLIVLLTGWLIVPLLGVAIWVIVEVCTVKSDGAGAVMV